jgi:hypothetical protein
LAKLNVRQRCAASERERITVAALIGEAAVEIPGTEQLTVALDVLEPGGSKGAAYSITTSARASSVGGNSMPKILAVCSLSTNSNLVGRTTGKSLGFSPLRIGPV